MFCRNCGKEVADGVKFCPGCGTPMGQAPAGPAPSKPDVEKPVPPVDVPKQPKKRGKLLIAIIAVIVLAVVIFAAVKLIGGAGSKGNGSESYVFMNDDYEWMFMKDMKEKTEEVEISDESLQNVRFSADGKYLYYIESDGGNLYKMEVAKIGKDGEKAEKLDKKVTGLTMLKNGSLLYYKEDEICMYDGKECFDLVDDVEDHYGTDADQKYVYYTEEEKDGYRSLHRVELKNGGESEELIGEYSYLCTPMYEDTIVYAVNDDGDTTVYSVEVGKSEEKLVKDIYSVFGAKADGGKVSFYYSVYEENEITLLDLYAGADDAKDDDLVDDMEDSVLADETLSIYRYENGKEELLVTQVMDYDTVYYVAGEKDVLIYNKLVGQLEPLAEVDDLDDIDEAWEMAEEANEAVPYVQYVDGAEYVLELEEEVELWDTYVVGKEVILEASDLDDYEDMYLFSYKLGKEGLEYVETIVDEEFSRVRVYEDTLYYFLEVDEEKREGDLYTYANGKTTELATEIYALYELESGQTYVMNDYDDGEYTINLMSGNGKLEEVASDVTSRWFLAGGKKIAYIEGDDLYLWDGKESRCLAKDVVSAVFADTETVSRSFVIS